MILIISSVRFLCFNLAGFYLMKEIKIYGIGILNNHHDSKMQKNYRIKFNKKWTIK